MGLRRDSSHAHTDLHDSPQAMPMVSGFYKVYPQESPLFLFR